MNTQKLLLKTVYCLAGILFLASIGFNIYQYQKTHKLSAELAGETDVINGHRTVKDENNIQAQLNNAKEELRKRKIQLSEELSQKKEYIKTRDRSSTSFYDYTNPAEQKRLREILKENIEEDYSPLFKKLNMEKNDFDLLLDMLLDREVEYRVLMEGYSSYGRSVEDKKDLEKQHKEILEKYKGKISQFLGYDKNGIFENHVEKLTERNNLQNFMEIMSPDLELNEDQTESLIDAMYAARKSVPVEKDNDDGRMTEEKITKSLEMQSRVYEKYMEAISKVMSPELTVKYKAYLKQQVEMYESLMKMSLYLDDADNNTL